MHAIGLSVASRHHVLGKTNENHRTRKSSVHPQGHVDLESHASLYDRTSSRYVVPFYSTIESTSRISILLLLLSLLMLPQLVLLFSASPRFLCNVEREEPRWRCALTMSFRPYARLSGRFTNSLALSRSSSLFLLRPSSSVSLSVRLSVCLCRSLPLSLSFSHLLFTLVRATYRADPLFLRATRVCYTMPLQVENTDRLGINRSRDTERAAGKEEGNARVTRVERNRERDGVTRGKERENEARGGKTW